MKRNIDHSALVHALAGDGNQERITKEDIRRFVSL